MFSRIFLELSVNSRGGFTEELHHTLRHLEEVSPPEVLLAATCPNFEDGPGLFKGQTR